MLEMGICRLCLKNIDGTGISNPEKTINLLQTFLPHMNRALINLPIVCEICFENVNAANQLLEAKNNTDAQIHIELRRLKLAKIDLKGFHKNLYMSGNIGVCRMCLNIINRPRIFLYENSTNILRHDFINIMMKYCNLKMDWEVSYKPVMCLKCWELLQITYTFKKNYLEVERKIREYCREFRLRNRNISIEILEKVKNYFSDEYCEIIASNIKQENGLVENIYSRIKKENSTAKNSSQNGRRLKRVKRENGKLIKNEELPDISIPRKRIRFNTIDNVDLMRVYYEVTNIEQDFENGYCKRLYAKWIESKPNRPIPRARLSAQVRNIVRKKLLSKAQLDSLKAEICAKIKAQHHTQEHFEQTEERNSDSDDSFMEEAVHSSFTPHIKSEPLSDSDAEFEYIEPKQEVESDCESLPQLERMDLQVQVKVEKIYSLEVKREAYDNYMQQDDNGTNAVEDINKNRRESLRGHNKEKDLFECPDCNFKTTDPASFERHIKLHQRRNHKIHQCTSCPYRIASKWLFNRHMKKHRTEEDEIPVLMPDALMSSIHL